MVTIRLLLFEELIKCLAICEEHFHHFADFIDLIINLFWDRNLFIWVPIGHTYVYIKI